MLDLHLTPLAPTRRPPHGGTDLQCGYRLALPDGFTVDEDDPLVASFGIVTPRVDSAGREDALQHEDFAPGAPLLLLPAIDGADDPRAPLAPVPSHEPTASSTVCGSPPGARR